MIAAYREPDRATGRAADEQLIDTLATASRPRSPRSSPSAGP